MTNSSEWFDTRPGEHCSIRVSGAETNGAYSIVEIVSDPLDGTPMHVHHNEDEHIFVLEGAARIAYGDKILEVAAGSSINLSKGIPHAWCNPHNTPLRFMAVCTPGGVEEALRIIADRSGTTDLVALAARFNVEVVGPGLLETAKS
jgi:mannose-6-phosphate isomerase-like protein (cupin superfamily)